MNQQLLEQAARDFIAKVDRGEARSTASYQAFKDALAAAPAQGATAQPLIKGAVYHLKDYGPAEYVGIDVYGGETTHQFKIGRTNRFLRPDMLTEQLATASRTPAGGSDLSRAQLEHIVGSHEQTIEQLREEVERWHRVAMEAGAVTCQGGGHIYPLKDEVKQLRAQVEAASTWQEPRNVLNWERAATATIEEKAHYLVADNGREWRDFDLHIMPGFVVKRQLAPEYVRGRPEWIAKIVRPEHSSTVSPPEKLSDEDDWPAGAVCEPITSTERQDG